MSKFRDKGRRGLVVAVTLGALIAVAVAGIAIAAGKSKEKACIGELCFEAGGKFTPKKLSKKKQTPIGLQVEGAVKTTDGTHPPALRQVTVETDKNGEIDVKGYPTCRSGQLQSRDTPTAERVCRPALIGKGHATAVVSFPEQPDVPAPSKVLVFNGGVKGGTTTLYIHAYIKIPLPAAIVTTVKIKKIHNGRYGLKSVASIPRIASGAGSVSKFDLEINKKFKRKGKTVSVLTAKCPDGRLQAHVIAKFEGGTSMTTDYVRPCTGK